MEETVFNPHDKFFKETWSDIENARSFFKDYLPENIIEFINLDTLRICKDSFIEKDLKEFFSDMLYEVSIKNKKSYIYLLLEHKSGFDKHTPIQILQYMLKIWQLHIKQKGFPLPIIIPLVLYHGKEKWTLQTDFRGLFDNSANRFKAYLPDFKYILYDLSRYKDEDIKGDIFLKAALLIFKYIGRYDFIEKLPDILSLLSSIAKSERGLEALETFFRYVFYAADLPVEKLKKIAVEKLHKDGEEVIMTIAERLINQGIEKGLKRGVEQGVQQGVQQGLRNAIINTLEARFNSVDKKIVETINNINDLERLNFITKQAVLINSPNELDVILN